MIRQIAIALTSVSLASGFLVTVADPAGANTFAVTSVNDTGVAEARARWVDGDNRLCARDLALDDWSVRASIRKPNGDVAFVWDGPHTGPTCRAISVGENVTIEIKACRQTGDTTFRCSRWRSGTS